MNLVPIPESTRKAHAKQVKKHGCYHPWWYRNELPSQAIEAVSTGRGSIKQGVRVFLIHGRDRTVFLGDICERYSLHEYVGLVEGTGWQPLVQLGRDVDMTK